MSSLLTSIKNKAKAFGEKLAPNVDHLVNRPVQTYDPSKHDVVIAGKSMTGWLSAEVKSPEVAEHIEGLDPTTVAVVKKVGVSTLTISFLPTSSDVSTLNTLQGVSFKYSKYFMIEIIENGSWYATYKAQFLKVRDVHLDADANDVTFEFVLIPTSQRDLSSFDHVQMDIAIDTEQLR